MEVKLHTFLISAPDRSGGSVVLQSLHSRGTRPWYTFDKILIEPRAGLNIAIKRTIPLIKQWTSSPYLITLQTELFSYIIQYLFTLTWMLVIFSRLGNKGLWGSSSNPRWPWDPDRRKTALAAALCWFIASISLSGLYKLLWLREMDTWWSLRIERRPP
jgi:hypothetical protein